jgi:hypothetical protein
MTTRVKLRRGTTAEHAAFTGAEAEITFDTDKSTVIMHDGVTQGGFEVAKQSTSLALSIALGG